MDRITKALQKLSQQTRSELKEILSKIDVGDFNGLDLKKLKGRKDIFRVRKGKMRIIFLKKQDSIKILSVERRSDKTYK